jgi:hypothetical protein
MTGEYARWRERFAEALDPRFHPIGYLDRRVAEGSARVFACPEAALIVELRPYPTGRFDGHVLIAAGDIGAIVGRLREEAEDWLREIGAAGAIVESRAGWGRALKACGYGVYQVAVRKDFPA